MAHYSTKKEYRAWKDWLGILTRILLYLGGFFIVYFTIRYLIRGTL